MTIENISRSIPTKECCRSRRGSPVGRTSKWATEPGTFGNYIALSSTNIFLNSPGLSCSKRCCNVRPQDIVTSRSNELLVRLGIEDLDLILKERRLRWYGHVECSNGAVKTVTYSLMESMGLGGPRWHGNSRQRGIAESGISRPSVLMIDIPWDLVWDLPCVQQASYL